MLEDNAEHNGVEGCEQGYLERSFRKGYEGQNEKRWFNFTVVPGIQESMASNSRGQRDTGVKGLLEMGTATRDRTHLAPPFLVRRETVIRLAVESQWIRRQILRQH